MNESELQAIGRIWQDDTAWEFLTRVTELGNRMSGHPGERRTAELVTDALTDAGGREIDVQPFDVRRWNRGSTILELTDPIERSFEAIALPYSPAGTIAGELVDVGSGTPEAIDAADVEGKIVLASTDTPPNYGRFVHRMEKYGHAVATGAVGFVFYNHVSGQLPPTGALQFNREGSIPAIGVSEETGAWLTDYADRGGSAVVEVTADIEPGSGHNAQGVFGPDTDSEVIIVAHHDAHDIAEGALDNGCGITVAVTAARLLADIELDTRVRIVGVGGEEIGLLGADTLATSIDLDRVMAVVNLDGAGRFRDMRAITHGSGWLRELVEEVSNETGHPIAIEDRIHPFSDHWPFVRRGVPALQLHSKSGERGRGWGHTHADTRDKVDARNLREHAILVALLVRKLATVDDMPRLTRDTVVEGLRERDLEHGMRAADIWPDEWK